MLNSSSVAVPPPPHKLRVHSVCSHAVLRAAQVHQEPQAWEGPGVRGATASSVPGACGTSTCSPHHSDVSVPTDASPEAETD